jgi:PAT family beta-lactamase induction signal transducer AmpG
MNATSQPIRSRRIWLWVSAGFLLQAIPAAIRDEALPAALKNLHASDTLNTRIVAILGLLVGIKILWAPLIIRLGPTRKFILAGQFLMAVLLTILAAAVHLSDVATSLIFIPLVLLSLLSAGHDFALDGYFVASLESHDRSRHAGLLNFASKLGQVLAGPGLIWLAGRAMNQGITPTQAWGQALYLAAGLTLLANLAVGYGFHHEPETHPAERPAILPTLLELFKDERFLAVLGLIFFYRSSEIHMSLVAKLFSLAPTTEGGLGLDNETYAILRLTTAVTGLALGGLLGSHFITKYGLKRSLVPLGIIMHLPLLGIAWLAHHSTVGLPIITSIFLVEYLVYGAGLCALLLAMMQLAQGTHAAIRYAALSTLGLLAAYLPGFWAGAWSTQLGYQNYFLVITLLAIPGIISAWNAKKYFA